MVPPPLRLPKFDGKSCMDTFNFGSNIPAAQAVLASAAITTKVRSLWDHLSPRAQLRNNPAVRRSIRALQAPPPLLQACVLLPILCCNPAHELLPGSAALPPSACPSCPRRKVCVSKNVCHSVVYDTEFHHELLAALAAAHGRTYCREADVHNDATGVCAASRLRAPHRVEGARRRDAGAALMLAWLGGRREAL